MKKYKIIIDIDKYDKYWLGKGKSPILEYEFYAKKDAIECVNEYMEVKGKCISIIYTVIDTKKERK